MGTLTDEPRTLNWWEHLRRVAYSFEWYAWRLWRRLQEVFKPRKELEKYTPEILAPEPVNIEWAVPGTSKVLPVTEPTLDVHYEGLTGAAISLRIDFQYAGDEILYITKTRIVFNVDPEAVPEDGIVNVDFKGDYGSHDLDLADLLAAAIGWEMTSWTVLKIMGYDAAHSFDDFVMWKDNKKHWFLPIPEEGLS